MQTRQAAGKAAGEVVKILRVSWDHQPCDYYIARWLSNARETHGTETEIDVPDDFAGDIQVVAVENGIESGPCVVWYEDMTLRVHWDDFHKCVVLRVPTIGGRRYVIERSLDYGKTWHEIAEFFGTGKTEPFGGWTDKAAWFRAWSKQL